MDRREQRELREGGGDALSASFEMIATPAVFGFLGWLLDREIGTFPVFTLVLAAVVLAYEIWRLYSAYAARMDEMLQERRASYGGGTGQERRASYGGGTAGG
ncbi:MAG: AtpZ/AtpI family protein [Acidimicrobiales bacterium]